MVCSTVLNGGLESEDRVEVSSYLVTLNVLSSRTQRRTDSPRGGMIFSLVRISSRILLMTTKQSKRLNSDMK